LTIKEDVLGALKEHRRRKALKAAVRKVLKIKTNYTQRKDGEGWEIKPGEIFKLACCDCGLVHNVVIVLEDGEVGMAAERNKRTFYD
jgi:hypothetical protein